VSSDLNNPEGIKPNDTKGNDKIKPFNWDVAINFPTSLRTMCMFYLVIALVVLILMPNFPET
jgi:hypothetical protein